MEKPLDKGAEWFWSDEWQQAEAEAEKDIETGRTSEFASVDDLIDHLNCKHDETLGNP